MAGAHHRKKADPRRKFRLTQNIFVSRDDNYKRADIGIAKTAERTMSGTKVGTYNYTVPEVYNNQPYGSASEMLADLKNVAARPPAP